MSTVSEAQLLAAIVAQTEVLSQILAYLKQPKLGLGEAPSVVWMYANRSNNCLWYTVQNGEPRPVNGSAVTGYLEDLRIETVERRGKQVVKVQAFIRGDRVYCVESGHESHFGKGLLAIVASLTPEQLRQPITLCPQAGEDDSVLFCRAYMGGQPVKTTYNESTDWAATTAQAQRNVQQVNPQGQPKAAAPATREPSATSQPNRISQTFEPEGNPVDLSDKIEAIGVELERVHWTKKQGSSYLQKTYGKKTRAELTPAELDEFCQYLKQLTPSDLVAANNPASRVVDSWG